MTFAFCDFHLASFIIIFIIYSVVASRHQELKVIGTYINLKVRENLMKQNGFQSVCSRHVSWDCEKQDYSIPLYVSYEQCLLFVPEPNIPYYLCSLSI